MLIPDDLDARIIELLTHEPKTSVLAASRTLGVARATIQARLDRMERTGVIASLAPTLDPARFGYPVTAFISLEIAQTELGRPAVPELEAIPEVIEIHSVSGAADLMLRVVARSNDDLQRVLTAILAVDSVRRTSSSIVMQTYIDARAQPLFSDAARAAERPAVPRE